MRIIITGGPTNEPIDKVMKITNMSTGKLAVEMAYKAAIEGHKVIAILTNSVNTRPINNFPNVIIERIETTNDLLSALEKYKGNDIDAVIHSSAVADYAPQFTFKMEDLAVELANKISDKLYEDKEHLAQEILKIMENPECKVNDETKISSYEPNLTVKLNLTPKVISNLRSFFPQAKIYGFKLLENVPKENLFDVAMKLCKKNQVNGIFANDLADLRNGIKTRYFVNSFGWTGKQLEGSTDIISFVLNN